MRRRYILTACIVLLIASGLHADERTIGSLVDTDKMANVLGDGWKRDRSMLIESEKDVTKLSGVEKQMGEMILKIMKPHGVIACGDFSFSRTQAPLNNLTVKVFKFSSSDKADAFRKLKYESEKAKPLYKKSETHSAVVYDSLQMKKRIVFNGVFWITCGHIQDDDQHIKILEKCVKLEGLQQPPERDK
jgi:hypothetical protein